MSQNPLALDLSTNLQNITLHDVFTRFLSISKEQVSTNAILRIGNETLSLNISKLSQISQEQIPDLGTPKENPLNTDSRKIEPLENSDSLVRHISEKEDTKQFIKVSASIPRLNKCSTYPKDSKPTLKPPKRHYSMEVTTTSKDAPLVMTRFGSQKAYNPADIKLFSGLQDSSRFRRYSNDMEVDLSFSKESLRSQKRLDSRLAMTKGESSLTFNKDGYFPYQKETSMNIALEKAQNSMNSLPIPREKTMVNKDGQMPYAKEISLNVARDREMGLEMQKKTSSNFGGASLNLLGSLSISKGLSSTKYKQSSEDISENERRKSGFVTTEHESILDFNASKDFNVSKSDSKSGSPVKKPGLSTFITIENQTQLDTPLKPYLVKSEDNSGMLPPELDLEKIDFSKSVCITDNSAAFERRAEGEKHSSPLGMKKSEIANTNTRYVSQKGMMDSKSYSTFSESVDNSMKRSTDEDYQFATQTIAELMRSTDSESQTYASLKKTLEALSRLNEKFSLREMQLQARESEIQAAERVFREKERKLNEILEKNSKSSTQCL